MLVTLGIKRFLSSVRQENACYSHQGRPFRITFIQINYQTICFNMLTVLLSNPSILIFISGTCRTNKVSIDIERYGQTYEK